MTYRFICSQCGAVTDVPEKPADNSLHCPSCTGDSDGIGVPMEELDTYQPSANDSFDGAPSRPSYRSPPTDVKVIRVGFVAAGLTGLFYAGVIRPIETTYVGQLLSARGWVPYVIMLLTFWSALILILKYIKLSRQFETLKIDLLPRKLVDEITADKAYILIRYIQSVANDISGNFLVNRLTKALQHYQSRRVTGEVSEQLRNQSEADANAVESSYSMLKVFIWAIPILGFIGTVLGIGQAVDGFSQSLQSAQDFDVLKESLGSVTSGLGIAFDTTLLALVMSLIIMFPTSSMQKAEEDFLANVEDYCNDHLLCRLKENIDIGADGHVSYGSTDTGVKKASDRVPIGSAKLETIGENIAEKTADEWNRIHDSIVQRIAIELDKFHSSAKFPATDNDNQSGEIREEFITQITDAIRLSTTEMIDDQQRSRQKLDSQLTTLLEQIIETQKVRDFNNDDVEDLVTATNRLTQSLKNLQEQIENTQKRNLEN